MSEVEKILDEMRNRKVGSAKHGKHTSPTLIDWADRIETAIAQASAAPEQGPVVWVKELRQGGMIAVSDLKYRSWADAEAGIEYIPLYAHADPSEVAQLRAWKFCPECGCEEIHHQEGNHKQCANCYQEWFSDMDYTDVVRTHLAGKFRDKDAVIEAATQRADAAERKLVEAVGLLREISNWLVCEPIATPEDMAQSFTPFRERIDGLLSASAEPANQPSGDQQ